MRLFPTLARFDAVYYVLFKCNLRRVVDYPQLWAYSRDLYQRPGFGDTTDFGEIKRHYYQAQDWINPSRIVPRARSPTGSSRPAGTACGPEPGGPVPGGGSGHPGSLVRGK